MLLFDSVVLVRGLSPQSHEVQPTWPTTLQDLACLLTPRRFRQYSSGLNLRMLPWSACTEVCTSVEGGSELVRGETRWVYRKQEKCKEGCVWAWTSIIMAVFKYDMAKIMHIKNKKVGLMNCLVQLIIISYVIGSLTASLS